MTPAEILDACAEAGARLSVHPQDEERLCAKAPKGVSEDLSAEILRAKAELLALLKIGACLLKGAEMLFAMEQAGEHQSERYLHALSLFIDLYCTHEALAFGRAVIRDRRIVLWRDLPEASQPVLTEQESAA